MGNFGRPPNVHQPLAADNPESSRPCRRSLARAPARRGFEIFRATAWLELRHAAAGPKTNICRRCKVDSGHMSNMQTRLSHMQTRLAIMFQQHGARSQLLQPTHQCSQNRTKHRGFPRETSKPLNPNCQRARAHPQRPRLNHASASFFAFALAGQFSTVRSSRSLILSWDRSSNCHLPAMGNSSQPGCLPLRSRFAPANLLFRPPLRV